MEQRRPMRAGDHSGNGGAFATPGLDREKCRRPPEAARLAFWSACVVGLITHIYIFTNLILNHDSVWRMVYDNDNLALGRWSLQFLSEFGSRFQMPVVIGLISILMLALTAGFTVSVLEVSNRTAAVLIGAFLVTMPSVACIFSYLFTADAYFICLFLNTLAVWLTRKYSWGWLPAIALCAMACGGYQAFICYAIGLFLIDCILALFKDVPVGKVLGRGVKYILVVVASLVVYYIVLLVLLKVKGVSLSSYQGLDSIVGFDINTLIAQIPRAYRDFIRYFIATPFNKGFFRVIQVLFLFVGLGSAVYMGLARRLWREWPRVALLAVGAALLPLALNFITVLSMGASVHALMIYSFVLLDVLALKLLECALECMIEKGVSLWPVVSWGSILLAGLLLWNNFCVSNIAYLRLQVCYENSFALANRIAARIETVEDYSPELPVAIVGEASRTLYGGTEPAFSQFNSMTGTNDKLLYSPEPHRRTRAFIRDYIGLHMPTPSGEQKAMLADSEFVKAMPCYPQEGSVAEYEGIIVVKLSEGEVR